MPLYLLLIQISDSIDSMEESSDLRKIRREKLAQLYAKGVDPYINRFKVSDNIGSLIDEFSEKSKESLEKIGRKCLIGGRMMARRGHGKTTFCHVKDRSSQIQIYRFLQNSHQLYHFHHHLFHFLAE